MGQLLVRTHQNVVVERVACPCGDKAVKRRPYTCYGNHSSQSAGGKQIISLGLAKKEKGKGPYREEGGGRRARSIIPGVKEKNTLALRPPAWGISTRGRGNKSFPGEKRGLANPVSNSCCRRRKKRTAGVPHLQKRGKKKGRWGGRQNV